MCVCFVSTFPHCVVITLISDLELIILWAQVVISDLGGAISCQNMGANKYHKYPPIHIPAQTGQGRAHLVSCTTRDKYSEKNRVCLGKHKNGMWMCNISNILVVILLLYCDIIETQQLILRHNGSQIVALALFALHSPLFLHFVNLFYSEPELGDSFMELDLIHISESVHARHIYFGLLCFIIIVFIWSK